MYGGLQPPTSSSSGGDLGALRASKYSTVQYNIIQYITLQYSNRERRMVSGGGSLHIPLCVVSV